MRPAIVFHSDCYDELTYYDDLVQVLVPPIRWHAIRFVEFTFEKTDPNQQNVVAKNKPVSSGPRQRGRWWE